MLNTKQSRVQRSSVSWSWVTEILSTVKNHDKNEILVANSITIEFLLSQKSKIDSQIDKMDTALFQILQYLKIGKVSSPMSFKFSVETRC